MYKNRQDIKDHNGEVTFFNKKLSNLDEKGWNNIQTIVGVMSFIITLGISFFFLNIILPNFIFLAFLFAGISSFISMMFILLIIQDLFQPSFLEAMRCG